MDRHILPRSMIQWRYAMMRLEKSYDPEVDVLSLRTGEAEATCSSLDDDPDVVLSLAHDETRVVGLEVLGASAYLPLGKCGYDVESDTLTLGVALSDEAFTKENGDIVSYWREFPGEPNMYPVGVALRQASKHLHRAGASKGGLRQPIAQGAGRALSR